MEANPTFDLADSQLAHNISELQNGAVAGVSAIPRAGGAGWMMACSVLM
ncbi:hypothetical protein [Corynebacterium pseudotuberculosis]|nr:hypothetical protein [Corynebacterium pseudotuberculosis]